MNLRIAAPLAALALVAASAFAESYYVVTTTDLLGNKTFSVKTAQQLKEETAQVRARAAALPKVLAQMQKEWKAKPEEHSGKFHGAKMKAPTIKQVGPISDAQKAQEKADKMTEREDASDEPQKTKKKLSKAEQEKQYEESLKKQEIAKFADDVDKAIDEFLKNQAATPKKNY